MLIAVKASTQAGSTETVDLLVNTRYVVSLEIDTIFRCIRLVITTGEAYYITQACATKIADVING